MKGYEGTLYEKLIVPSGANPLLSRGERQLITTRQTIKSLIQSTQLDQYEGLLLGMLVGDRSLLSQKEYQHFIQSGIVHIIAVSGGNLVMIIIFLSGILFRIPFYPRNVIIILGVISFALIAGGDSSVIRALIMSLFSLLALFWGREINIWRLMSYAFVIMLCYNPYFLVYDLGFLLSFGALIGIIIISEQRNLNTQNIKHKLLKSARIRTPISSYILPTLGATL